MVVKLYKDGILIAPETEFEEDYLQNYGPGEKLKCFVTSDEDKTTFSIKVEKSRPK